MEWQKARWRHAGCANVRDFRDWVLQMTLKNSHILCDESSTIFTCDNFYLSHKNRRASFSVFFYLSKLLFSGFLQFKVQLTPNMFFRLMESTSFPNYFSEKISRLIKSPRFCRRLNL